MGEAVSLEVRLKVRGVVVVSLEVVCMDLGVVELMVVVRGFVLFH